MGKHKLGILGGFRGKVGTVSGASWKGIEYMKGPNRGSDKPATQKQLEARGRFLLMIRFLSQLSSLLKLGFKDSAIKMTGTNAAYRLNKNAIQGVYPNYSLDYSKLVLTDGPLQQVVNPKAEALGAGKLTFSWDDNTGIKHANADDKSILLVYCPEKGHFAYVDDGSPRSSKSASIDAGVFNGMTVETWLSFISVDGEEVAPSVYTGQLTVVV
jgi:hypothetical protein